MLRKLFKRLLGKSIERPCDLCRNPQLFHITLANAGAYVGEKHLCERCAQRFLALTNAPVSPEHSQLIDAKRDVAIEIDQIILNERHDQQVVMFKEVDGSRRFPFICGIFEATALDRTLRRMAVPRPLTHDAWFATIAGLGTQVQSACITDLRAQIYFAELRLAGSGGPVSVDVRPSDAVIIALKAGVPFLIREDVLRATLAAG